MERAKSPEYEPGKIFVGGLSWNTEDANMKVYFEQFGTVTDCIVMKDQNQPPGIKKNRGFGFVKFEDPAVVDAVVATPTHSLDGKTIDPKRAEKKSGVKDTDKKVFIGGLSSSTTKEDVEDYFNTNYEGGVVEVVFKEDTETKRKRGFGFVVFESTDYVERVLQTQFHEINGKKVEVKKAEPRSATASAMRQTNPGLTYYPGPYGGDYSSANGQYGQWPGGNQQYYNPPYPQQHQGYGAHYSAAGGYSYDHSGYSRTQSSTGDRTDPQSYYQPHQHSYAQQQPAGGGGGYGHENGGYPQARGGGYSAGHGGYGGHAAGYGRGGGSQQQRYAGGYSH